MKLDLRKDKGLLKSTAFSAEASQSQDLSEDELIAETLRRRHDKPKIPTAVESSTTDDSTEKAKPKKKKRSPIWLFMLLWIVIAGSSYYLERNDLLQPNVNIIKWYWMDVFGKEYKMDISSIQIIEEYLPLEEEVLSDDMFNQLMPVTDDIAAMADSIFGILADDSIQQIQSDEFVAEDTITEYLEVPETPIQLSDDDITIINNRSLLLLATEILEKYPENIQDSHLFLKRDALRITASTGGAWVAQIDSTLDKFVLGTFNEDYTNGKAKISSKFEIIMNAERDFQAHVLDGMRLLDVLANPFYEYLVEINIDISRGVDDNPATFVFSGSKQEIQYVLSSWAETRGNFLLQSIDVKFRSGKLTLSFDVIFFNYLQ